MPAKPKEEPLGRYALMGHPVSHSYSPFIHGLFAQQLGHRLKYQLIDVTAEKFRAAAMQFFLDGGRGLNVTVPHKRAAAELVNELSPRAARVGAVNTIGVKGRHELYGDNTDGLGLIIDLKNNLKLNLRGLRILILGAGGATSGIAAPLLDAKPARILIANRRPERAVALATQFAAQGEIEGCGYPEVPAEPFDLVINATSASLEGEVPPVPDAVFSRRTVAYDLGYARGETAFTRHALQAGAGRAFRGWGMLVEQAAEAYLLWHGVRPETAQVLEALSTGR